MTAILVDDKLCTGCGACQDACLFGAITILDGKAAIGQACARCGACKAACPTGAIRLQETHAKTERTERGILIFGQLEDGRLIKAVAEMAGLAYRLRLPGEEISLVCVGTGGEEELARQAARLGAATVYLCQGEEYAYFKEDLYAAALAAAVKRENPSVVLLAATPEGRAIAPRVAAKFQTGLTADCTALRRKENGELLQIRPAFGGDVMAEIVTRDARPQMATVRPGLFSADVLEKTNPRIVRLKSGYLSPVQILAEQRRKAQDDIAAARVLVAIGNGVKRKEDLPLFEKFAEMLGGQLAGSRPIIEKGWLSAERQIGLSGKTVNPDLLIALGISGSVQFLSGVGKVGQFLAINQDADAPIARAAHTLIRGDLYEWVPRMMREIGGAAQKQGES